MECEGNTFRAILTWPDVIKRGDKSTEPKEDSSITLAEAKEVRWIVYPKLTFHPFTTLHFVTVSSCDIYCQNIHCNLLNKGTFICYSDTAAYVYKVSEVALYRLPQRQRWTATSV